MKATPDKTPTVTFEAAMSDWREAVTRASPLSNTNYVRMVCEEVVRRAQILSEQSRLNFPEVAAFLLMRSRDWVLGGLPVSKIGEKMPKTLADLGYLQMAEGGPGGGPISDDSLKQANRATLYVPHGKTIQ